MCERLLKHRINDILIRLGPQPIDLICGARSVPRKNRGFHMPRDITENIHKLKDHTTWRATRVEIATISW